MNQRYIDVEVGPTKEGNGPRGARGDDTPGQGEPAESLGGMLSEVIANLRDLLRGEVRLAKAELKENVTQAGKGIGYLAAGAFMGLVGFIFLMLAVTYILNQWVQMWIAAGIVGVTLAAAAVVLAMSGKKRLSGANLKPEQTIDTLKEDKAWASQQIKSVKN
ncbi:MAG: phage holin family protein [Chloroflexota bacterium]|nr:phage holin family protein [Chloroflexota bacterium]